MESLVKEWLRQDQDDESRKEIEGLWKNQDFKELESRLSKRLAFGTAGLRAQMGAGFSRINSLTIIQTSQGLAEHLLKIHADASNAGVVIGHDARHNSEKLAELTAAAFVRKGIKVWWFEHLVHTPLVPFAVVKTGAVAGVMITASHNPAKDNGYKVYASNGCQIVSPADKRIADSISQNLEPLEWHFPHDSNLIEQSFALMKRLYKAAVVDYTRGSSTLEPPKFIYTPLHGVGLPFMKDAMSGLTNADKKSDNHAVDQMIIVSEQAEPDPDFSTVKYPNPEEEGALDLAKACADRNGISLILANDPDADRFAAAEKINGTWIQFTGDQVGILLANYIFTHLEHKVTNKDVVLNSAVSSSMLSHIAAAEGFTVEETLTGFKWLGNRALDLEWEGKQVHFAYEEALGYMFPSIVHDKDGIVAARVFLNACGEWGSPWAKLQELYSKYGYFQTMNTYWRSPNTNTTLQVFHNIQAQYNKAGTSSIGDRTIVRWRDLAIGYDDGAEDEKAVLPSSPDTLMITCWLSGSGKSDGARFTVRASGTEPKIKLYLECWGSSAEWTKEDAKEILRILRRSWFADPALSIEEKYQDL